MVGGICGVGLVAIECAWVGGFKWLGCWGSAPFGTCAMACIGAEAYICNERCVIHGGVYAAGKLGSVRSSLCVGFYSWGGVGLPQFVYVRRRGARQCRHGRELDGWLGFHGRGR